MNGDSNGGSNIIDYTVVLSSDGGDTYTERQVGITTTSVTMFGFNLGVTYFFKVKARNSYGFSLLSSPT